MVAWHFLLLQSALESTVVLQHVLYFARVYAVTTIRAHMEKLWDHHGLVGMTRLATVFMIPLCTIEPSLCLDFFGDAVKGTHNLMDNTTIKCA